MYKKLLQSNFIRSVMLVATGTAGAQVLSILFSPIITRLYGVEEFGLLGTFSAILIVLTPIAALTYPIAIVLPKKDDDAKGIAKLSAYIAGCISFVLIIIIFFLGDRLAVLLNLESISNFFIFIPLALFFTSLQQIMQQWLIRKKQFKVTARISISQSLILNSTKVGAGILYPVGATLIVLATLGSALYSLQLWLGSRKWSAPQDRINSKLASSVNLQELAAKHKDFPLYRAPQQFINALSQSLPILMLASTIGPAAAGFYTLAKSIMAAPAALLGKSVGDVFYPRINEASHNNDNLSKLISRATLTLSVVATPPFMIVFAFGPDIFSFVFGVEWNIAGEYASWLSLWLLFSLLNKPCVAALPVLNLQLFFLFYEIISLVVRVITLYVCLVVYNNDILAVKLLSLTGCLLNFMLIIISIHKCNSITLNKN